MIEPFAGDAAFGDGRVGQLGAEHQVDDAVDEGEHAQVQRENGAVQSFDVVGVDFDDLTEVIIGFGAVVLFELFAAFAQQPGDVLFFGTFAHAADQNGGQQRENDEQ